MYARIQHGVVADVRQTHPKGFFVDEFAAQFVTVPDDVGNGWAFDGSTYTPPPAPYVPSQEELDAIAAAEAARTRQVGKQVKKALEQPNQLAPQQQNQNALSR